MKMGVTGNNSKKRGGKPAGKHTLENRIKRSKDVSSNSLFMCKHLLLLLPTKR